MMNPGCNMTHKNTRHLFAAPRPHRYFIRHAVNPLMYGQFFNEDKPCYMRRLWQALCQYCTCIAWFKRRLYPDDPSLNIDPNYYPSAVLAIPLKPNKLAHEKHTIKTNDVYLNSSP